MEVRTCQDQLLFRLNRHRNCEEKKKRAVTHSRNVSTLNSPAHESNTCSSCAPVDVISYTIYHCLVGGEKKRERDTRCDLHMEITNGRLRDD